MSLVLAGCLGGCGASTLEKFTAQCIVSALITDGNGSNPRTVPMGLGQCPAAPTGATSGPMRQLMPGAR